MSTIRKSIFSGIVEFYNSMNTGRRVLYLFCSVIFTLYIFVLIHLIGSITPSLSVPMLLLIPLIFVLVFCGAYLLSKINIETKGERNKLSKRVFFVSFGFCLFVLILYYAAYFPGGFSNDTITQWQQAQSGDLNDWHPAVHTLLILIASRIINHIAFVIALQIVAFSLCVGYQTAVLRAFGFPKWLCALSCIFVSAAPPTGNILMYAWKDCAFAIFMILAMTHLIQIYLTKGKWFIKPLNIIAFVTVLVMALFMRHNALFAIFPIIILLAFLYYKVTKKVLIVLVATILVWGIVKGPVFTILNVSSHGQAIAESAGVPMTLLGNVMKNNPDALSDEAKEFMEKIAPAEEWKTNYKLGSWNSMKWEDGSLYDPESNTVIEELGAGKLIKYTLLACKNDPDDCFAAFSELTRCVWQLVGNNSWSFEPNCIQNDYGFTQTGNSLLKSCAEKLNHIISLNYFSWTCWNTGFFILILLVLALSKIAKKGFKVLLLIAPVIVYDFGTMLLLCGDDYRFFYFNLPIFIMLCATLLSSQKTDDTNLNLKQL